MKKPKRKKINSKNTKIKKSPVFNGGVAYGVYYSKSLRLYCSQIRVNNAQKFLGFFKSKQEAIDARKENIVKMYDNKIK
jgi:hypothetical protein